MPAPTIFISYSHKDESLMEELWEFLQPLKFSGRINIWSDKAIPVGSLWDDEIKTALDSAQIVMFLLSPSFLASSYINRVELMSAVQNWKARKTRLIPIMLRPCDLESHIVPGIQGENGAGEPVRISSFLGLPKDMRAVIKWETHEDAWIDVTNGLKRVLDSLANAPG